jgi:hypothetical protein
LLQPLACKTHTSWPKAHKLALFQVQGLPAHLDCIAYVLLPVCCKYITAHYVGSKTQTCVCQLQAQHDLSCSSSPAPVAKHEHQLECWAYHLFCMSTTAAADLSACFGTCANCRSDHYVAATVTAITACRQHMSALGCMSCCQPVSCRLMGCKTWETALAQTG